MDSQSRETVEQTKKTIKNSKKKWTDDEVQDLNQLLVIPRPLVSSSFSESSNSTITKALNILFVRHDREWKKNFQKHHNRKQ